MHGSERPHLELKFDGIEIGTVALLNAPPHSFFFFFGFFFVFFFFYVYFYPWDALRVCSVTFLLAIAQCAPAHFREFATSASVKNWSRWK